MYISTSYSTGNLGLGDLNLHIHGKERALQKWNFDESAFDELTREAHSRKIGNGSSGSPSGDYQNSGNCDSFDRNELGTTSTQEEIVEDQNATKICDENDLNECSSHNSSCSSNNDGSISASNSSSGGNIQNGDENTIHDRSSSSSIWNSSSSNNQQNDNEINSRIDINYKDSDIKIETPNSGILCPIINSNSDIKDWDIKSEKNVALKETRNEKTENLQMLKTKKIQKRMIKNEDEDNSDTEENIRENNEMCLQKSSDGRKKYREIGLGLDNSGHKGKQIRSNQRRNDNEHKNENDYNDYRSNNEDERKTGLRNGDDRQDKLSSDVDCINRKRNKVDNTGNGGGKPEVKISPKNNLEIGNNDASDTKNTKRKKDGDLNVKKGRKKSVHDEIEPKQGLSSVSASRVRLTPPPPSVMCPICENELPLGKLTADYVLDKHIDKCTRRMDSGIVKRGIISKGFYNENNDNESGSDEEEEEEPRNSDSELISNLHNKRSRKASRGARDANNDDISRRDESSHDGNNHNEKNLNTHNKNKRLKSSKIESWMDCEDSSNSSNDKDDDYSDPHDNDEGESSENSFIDDDEILSRKKSRITNKKGINEKKKEKKKELKKGAVDIVDHKLDRKEKKRAEKLLKVKSKLSKNNRTDDGRLGRATDKQGRIVEDKVVCI